MIPTDTFSTDTAPSVRPPPPGGAWLSRRDWRRAVRRWATGGMDRAELETLKARLVRLRAGGAGAGREEPGTGRGPTLRLLRGGRAAGEAGTRPALRGGPGRAA